jgi:hypothetical protein
MAFKGVIFFAIGFLPKTLVASDLQVNGTE